MQRLEYDGFTVTVYRYAFRGGYYAEATDASGKRLAFTGVFRGKQSRQRAIDAAVHQARTGRADAHDSGCPG